MIGRSLSHYRILAKLGAGGMGEVYDAEDTHLGRRVAIKILPEGLATKREVLQRFQREARALAALNHPNIITIHSVEEAGGHHFITMERVEGKALGQIIPEGGLGLEKFFAYAIPLADALAAAHQKGIGHRDLKPSNVMVNERGQVKVIDFGLAKLFDPDPEAVDLQAPTRVDLTGQSQILGTPAYMSPEQIEGRDIDHRTDIFSLGILLCEMATGQRPFKGDSAMAIMSSILRDSPPPLSELKPGSPEHLGRILRRCLQKKPDERYQNALEVRNELKGLEGETKLPQGSPPAPARAAQPARKDLSTTELIAPPLAPATIPPNNLPVQLTSFVGRERETAEVTRLLAGKSGSEPSGMRLLTLTGAGGTGKTRLALQVAGGLVERFPDGVWLVELAALSDASLVPQTVVSAMGLINAAGQPPLELLTRFLAPKRTLLLLDNCEHLVVACASVADALLRGCPRLQILVTSREGLRLAGETTWPVPSLSVPSLAVGQLGNGDLGEFGQYESVKLFVERANAATSAFKLSEQNVTAVARLCQRLDGIPLAIELAAARTRLLPVDQLLDRVQDRFRLLNGGSRTALPRQQTLRALVDWSYDLLSDQERLLFDRLSVFAGGWTIEAAEAVCADESGVCKIDAPNPADLIRSDDILDLLGRLLEKSMIVDERSAQGAPRFRMLETLRQYAQERLAARGEAAVDPVRVKHVAYFTARAEQVRLGMRGPDQVGWPERLEIEHGNIRAGLEWGKAPDAPPDRVEMVLRLAAPLYHPWFRRGHGREGRQHFEKLLSHPNAQRPTLARAQVLYVTGSLAFWQDGDEATAFALLTESLSLAESLGDTRVIADARHNLGLVVFNRGDKEAARRHHEEALRLSRADGDAYGIRWALEDLADLAADEGDIDRASKLQEEALSLARQNDDQHGIASTLQSMGVMAGSTGNIVHAEELMGEGLNIMQRIGCLNCSVKYLGDLAFLASASGEPERTVRLLGAADALRERTGIVASTASAGRIEQALGEARQHLSEAGYAIAWSEGRAMSLQQVTIYALRQSAPVLSSS